MRVIMAFYFSLYQYDNIKNMVPFIYLIK